MPACSIHDQQFWLCKNSQNAHCKDFVVPSNILSEESNESHESNESNQMQKENGCQPPTMASLPVNPIHHRLSLSAQTASEGT